MEIKKKLLEKSGTVALNIGIVVIVLVLLLAVTIEVYRMYHITNVVKDETNAAVLAVAAINVSGFYGGAREGDGQARTPSPGDFSYLVQTDDVMIMMANSLSLETMGNDRLAQQGNFAIEDIHVRFENYTNETLNFVTQMELVIELSLSGEFLPNVRLPLEVKTSYHAKF